MSNKDVVDPKTGAGSVGEKSAMSRLRLLDFDDLFLLSHLLEGNTIAATAKQLGLTQPAITQRVRKIERVFVETILQKAGRHVRLTKEGRAICVKAADALALMRGVTAEPAGAALTVGAEPLQAAAWLWPAASDLHETRPDAGLVHCVVAGGDELAALLETGGIDAWLTSQPYAGGLQGVADLAEAEYVFVARPDVAARIKSVADLAQVLLLEIDRSYPLLSRLESIARAQARFGGVWFLGSGTSVLQAALSGQGVTILPASLAAAPLAGGRLGLVLPEIDVLAEPIRLVYRHDQSRAALVEALAERLRLRLAAR